MKSTEIIARIEDLIEDCNEEIRYDKKYGNVTRVQIAEGKRAVLLKLLNEIK